MTNAPPIEVSFEDSDIRREVLAYCGTHGLAEAFRAAVELALETYRQVTHIEARMQPDPDIDDCRVVIDVTVVDSPQNVLLQKKEFTRRWVDIAPPEARARIRVLYQIA